MRGTPTPMTNFLQKVQLSLKDATLSHVRCPAWLGLAVIAGQMALLSPHVLLPWGLAFGEEGIGGLSPRPGRCQWLTAKRLLLLDLHLHPRVSASCPCFQKFPVFSVVTLHSLGCGSFPVWREVCFTKAIPCERSRQD